MDEQKPNQPVVCLLITTRDGNTSRHIFVQRSCRNYIIEFAKHFKASISLVTAKPSVIHDLASFVSAVNTGVHQDEDFSLKRILYSPAESRDEIMAYLKKKSACLAPSQSRRKRIPSQKNCSKNTTASTITKELEKDILDYINARYNFCTKDIYNKFPFVDKKTLYACLRRQIKVLNDRGANIHSLGGGLYLHTGIVNSGRYNVQLG